MMILAIVIIFDNFSYLHLGSRHHMSQKNLREGCLVSKQTLHKSFDHNSLYFVTLNKSFDMKIIISGGAHERFW